MSRLSLIAVLLLTTVSSTAQAHHPCGDIMQAYEFTKTYMKGKMCRQFDEQIYVVKCNNLQIGGGQEIIGSKKLPDGSIMLDNLGNSTVAYAYDTHYYNTNSRVIGYIKIDLECKILQQFEHSVWMDVDYATENAVKK